jgi:hypothetical protein
MYNTNDKNGRPYIEITAEIRIRIDENVYSIPLSDVLSKMGFDIDAAEFCEAGHETVMEGNAEYVGKDSGSNDLTDDEISALFGYDITNDKRHVPAEGYAVDGDWRQWIDDVGYHEVDSSDFWIAMDEAVMPDPVPASKPVLNRALRK